ncbi:ABC transporter ATP-binding protein [Halalkalicoccus salilacus]|uniref:ABC transporter ATP-binding protein n=1 Tax=Halalkalicoccus salilacus TaxID=3117459 RepID=UPI00300EB44A
MSAIELDGLTKRYGDGGRLRLPGRRTESSEVVGIDDISFSVAEGEVFGFLGPNGAGKTTTIRTLLGLIAPTAGTAAVLGADVRDEAALVEAKRRIGYLPADLGFDGEVTGERVLDLHAAIKGESRREELLELFAPPLEREIREYSTGNERMLGIVQAFMHDPDLVIMDEPTSGLDPLKQERFHEFLREERERGTTVFFSSHVLSEVRQVCDRVGILRDGRLVALEDVETLLARGGKRVRVRLAEPVGPEAFAIDGTIDVSRVGDSLSFTYAGEYNALLEHLAGYDVHDVEIGEPPLEDVFMHYYGERDEPVLEMRAKSGTEAVDA